MGFYSLVCDNITDYFFCVFDDIFFQISKSMKTFKYDSYYNVIESFTKFEF